MLEFVNVIVNMRNSIIKILIMVFITNMHTTKERIKKKRKKREKLMLLKRKLLTRTMSRTRTLSEKEIGS